MIRTFRFVIKKDLTNQFKQISKFGLSLDNAFTIKSDILNSSFMYEFVSHDTIKLTKLKLTNLFKQFDIEKIDWSVTPETIRQHTFVVSQPTILIEQKKK